MAHVKISPVVFMWLLLSPDGPHHFPVKGTEVFL